MSAAASTCRWVLLQVPICLGKVVNCNGCSAGVSRWALEVLQCLCSPTVYVACALRLHSAPCRRFHPPCLAQKKNTFTDFIACEFARSLLFVRNVFTPPQKKNTFTDFIACAEHLVSHKYTTPHKLCIEGRSGGSGFPSCYVASLWHWPGGSQLCIEGRAGQVLAFQYCCTPLPACCYRAQGLQLCMPGGCPWPAASRGLDRSASTERASLCHGNPACSWRPDHGGSDQHAAG